MSRVTERRSKESESDIYSEDEDGSKKGGDETSSLVTSYNESSIDIGRSDKATRMADLLNQNKNALYSNNQQTPPRADQEECTPSRFMQRQRI